MKRFLAGLTLALAIAVPASGAAAPSAKTTRHVHILLNAPEHVPTAAEWQGLGSDASEVLASVALDKKTLVLKRGRAATALMYFKTAASKQALTSIVTDAKSSLLLKGKAARSLAVSYQADALTHIEPMLSHDNKRMREVAIKAIGLVPASRSASMLRARLDKEKNDHLRGLLSATITRLAKTGGTK